MKHFHVSNNVSTEGVIDRQGNIFFNELVNEMKLIKNKVMNGKSRGIWNNFEFILKKHTNMAFKISSPKARSTKEAIGCIQILPQYINNNHVYFEEYLRPFLIDDSRGKVVFKKPEGIKGKVDLANGKVYGDFTEFLAKIEFSTYLLEKNILTEEQAVAIILHEVGHQFTFFTAMDKVVRVNQVLAQLVSGINNTKDLKQRTILLQSAADIFDKKHFKPEEIKEIALKDDETAIKMFLVKAQVSTRDSDLGGEYNLTMSEQSADQFVVRLGAGYPLAQGLELIDKLFGLKVFQKTREEFRQAELIRMTSYIINPIAFFLKKYVDSLVLTSLYSGVFPIMGIILTISLMVITLITGKIIAKSGLSDYRYDNPRTRILRLKQDLVNQLKETNKEASYYQAILTDIDNIDKILKNYYQEDSILIKWAKGNDYSNYVIQRELEDLAANDLFIHAAKFKYS